MLKNKLTHDPVNRCIYCDSLEDLTDEHIIPFGLGGEHILPKASCKRCAKITAAFEQEVLRGVWWLARALLKFPTRRPKDMPSSFKIQAETKDGQRIEITLEEKDKFAVAGFLEFAPPAFLSPREFSPGILITGHRIIGFGTSVEDLAKKYNIRSISGSITYSGTSLARMMAKIALGIGVARFGLDQFKEIYVRDCILNKKDDVSVWVGSDYWEVPSAQLEHELKSRNGSAIAVDENGNVLVRVRLFSFSPHSPAYIVVVGRLKPNVSSEMSGKVAEAFTKIVR